MKIIIDTREQKPLEFQHHFITEVVRQKLIVGDYMVMFKDGYIPPISYERKSLSDLVGSLSKGYKRFRKEIIRAKENNIQLIIIIEGSLTRIIKGFPESQRCGEEIFQQLNTIKVRYGVPYIPLNNREEISKYIIEHFLAYGRERFNNK